MSSEWDVGDGGNGPMFRQWANNFVDEDWGFGALNEDDWTTWDEAIADGSSLNDLAGDEPPSSATFPSSSPPRLSRESPPRHASTRQPNGVNGTHSLRAMGNASSSANTTDSRSQEPQQLAHPQPTTSNRSRIPAANHREDWLDRTATERPSEFGYITEGLFQDIQTPNTSDTSFTSDGIDIDDILNTVTTNSEVEDMPPTTRRRRQTGDSVVDLTQDSSPPAQSAESARQSRSRKRSAEASSQGRASKRSKRSDDPETKVEELDLTNEAPSAEEELLQAQQQEAISAQQAADEESKGPLKIGRRQCIICMENFTNATIAHCGHIYCHECLTQALLAGEKNSERGVGNCPVCRKPVKRTGKNQIIPINFMKKSTFKGKARRDMALLA